MVGWALVSVVEVLRAVLISKVVASDQRQMVVFGGQVDLAG